MTLVTDYAIRWRISGTPQCTIWLRFPNGTHYLEPDSASEALAYAAVLRDTRATFWQRDAKCLATGEPQDDTAGLGERLETEFVEWYQASWAPGHGWIRIYSYRAPDECGRRENLHDTLHFDHPAAFAAAMEALQVGALHLFIRSDRAVSGAPMISV
ncbi:MAG: hypothetical protein ACYC7A_18070 [Thermoanaerobaculia bacterium]